MRIRTLTVGPIGTLCYIVSPDAGGACVVIDPGAEPGTVRAATDGKRIDAILLTHGHFDHIGAVGRLMEKDTRLMIHPADESMLGDPDLNASLEMIGTPVTAPAPTDRVHEGDTLVLAGLPVTVMHTPGHTPGSVCYQIGDELFTGDTLFEHGWGRTDLPGGDMNAMMASLRRMLRLSKTMPIHPGHGG